MTSQSTASRNTTDSVGSSRDWWEGGVLLVPDQSWQETLTQFDGDHVLLSRFCLHAAQAAEVIHHLVDGCRGRLACCRGDGTLDCRILRDAAVTLGRRVSGRSAGKHLVWVNGVKDVLCLAVIQRLRQSHSHLT